MNKHFEYMSLGIPFVSFDLDEGRKISGDTSIYASDNCPLSLADAMARLIDDRLLRDRVSEAGMERAKSLLRWETERANLLAAYELALGEKAVEPGLASRTTARL
jgi:glycosyltransferase involved in cell wall biosynthesis